MKTSRRPALDALSLHAQAIGMGRRPAGDRSARDVKETAMSQLMKPEVRTLPVVSDSQDRRRLFMKSLGAGVIGAAAVAAGVSGSERVAAGQSAPDSSAADVFIGKSVAAQEPAHTIECPLFFMNGQAAGASHTLDVSTWRFTGLVTGTISSGSDTITPDFSSSSAAAITHGTDGELYFVVAAEGSVAGGTGAFRGVSKVILRSKYKVAVEPTGNPLLIACADCVVLLTA